jgi:transcriptional regulator with XRE-family HTH domain
VAEIAAKMGVNRSVVFRVEKREAYGKISLETINRMALAMGCVLIYAIIPRHGETMEDMAERRKWTKALGKRE